MATLQATTTIPNDKKGHLGVFRNVLHNMLAEDLEALDEHRQQVSGGTGDCRGAADRAAHTVELIEALPEGGGGEITGDLHTLSQAATDAAAVWGEHVIGEARQKPINVRNFRATKGALDYWLGEVDRLTEIERPVLDERARVARVRRAVAEVVGDGDTECVLKAVA